MRGAQVKSVPLLLKDLTTSECNAWNSGSHPVTMRGASLRTTPNTEDSREKMEEMGSLVTPFSCCVKQPWNHLDFPCEILNCRYLSQLPRGFSVTFSPKHRDPLLSHALGRVLL